MSKDKIELRLENKRLKTQILKERETFKYIYEQISVMFKVTKELARNQIQIQILAENKYWDILQYEND